MSQTGATSRMAILNEVPSWGMDMAEIAQAAFGLFIAILLLVIIISLSINSVAFFTKGSIEANSKKSHGLISILLFSINSSIPFPLKIAIYGLFPPFLFVMIYATIMAGGNRCIDSPRDYIDIYYFSFTTFTTLGYGDMRPVGVCRIITSIEAVSGYIFLGLVVAFASEKARKPDN